MTENKTLVAKHQLLDYVSKREFNDFVEEMRDFRDLTERKLNSIELRLSLHDRKFDEIMELIRVQTGAVLDQFREDLRAGMEYVKYIDESKVDKRDFEEFMDDIKNKLLVSRERDKGC